MTMHVRDRLARLAAVLHRDVETTVLDGARGEIPPREHPLDFLRGGEEGGELCGGEVREPRDDAEGDDEHVAGEDGLDVDEGVAEGGLVEDLERVDGV